MRKRIDLIIIDPQNGFCHPHGNLYVPGANQDMRRLSQMINRLGNKITRIHVTMDCHRTLHVAHPIMWVDSKGNHPAPFTTIKLDDIKNGTWKASEPFNQRWQSEYVEKLAANKRYDLMIWPPHCEIGTTDNAIFNGEDQILKWPEKKADQDALIEESRKVKITPEERLWDAFRRWEYGLMRPVNYVSKGSHMKSEHYSAVLADVPDNDEPSTQMNTKFVMDVEEADLIVFAGEALSHCLKNTATDMFSLFGPDSLKKVVLLTDATSSVPGCEALSEAFIKEFTAKGMQLSNTKDFLT